MKKNMGTTDKFIRTLFAAVVLVLYLTHTITGGLSLLLVTFALIFALTSYISFCPIYWMFGISTCKVKESPKTTD
ncbi:MAG: DUF2892 domain-containing protein [Saprospiraceae bacterium]|jgi:hypothetical protein|nr:DUF2892 domain-containing protein [Saprospiraceae bacterium]